jgi:hypothetical protein
MEKSGKTRNMNNTMPEPKKYHSNDGHTFRNNLPATIARLEAYSKHLQNKKTSGQNNKDQQFDY